MSKINDVNGYEIHQEQINLGGGRFREDFRVSRPSRTVKRFRTRQKAEEFAKTLDTLYTFMLESGRTFYLTEKEANEHKYASKFV